eukprot:3934975-Rhodomonas_salina.1
MVSRCAESSSLRWRSSIACLPPHTMCYVSTMCYVGTTPHWTPTQPRTRYISSQHCIYPTLGPFVRTSCYFLDVGDTVTGEAGAGAGAGAGAAKRRKAEQEQEQEEEER